MKLLLNQSLDNRLRLVRGGSYTIPNGICLFQACVTQRIWGPRNFWVLATGLNPIPVDEGCLEAAHTVEPCGRASCIARYVHIPEHTKQHNQGQK